VFFHPKLDAASRQRLMDEATDPSNAGKAWRPGRPLAEAQNAHYSNKPGEMLAALQGDFNFLEADFRMEGLFRRLPVVDRWREPVAAHDTFESDGLTLGEWLEVGAASERGLKIDIKQAAAIPKIIAEVKKRNIHDQRLIFNADIQQGPGGPSRFKLLNGRLFQDLTTDLGDLKRIRAAFPNATISIGAYTGKQPPGTTYADKHLDRFTEIADEVGGPFQFALRAEFVDAATVARLKPHGQVAIWNDPSSFSPPDIDAEIRRLRALGVDGMIDLRQA